MPIDHNLIDSIVAGREELEPPKHDIPQDLLQFAKVENETIDPVSFWANVDFIKLEKFLTYSQEKMTPELLDFHIMVGHQAYLVLPYLERRYELENRNPNYDKEAHEYWHRTYQAAKRTLNYLHPDALGRRIAIDVLPPRKKGSGKGRSPVSGETRKPPEMPMRIAVPFLEAINGKFIQKFDESELSYLFHKLTGYSQTNMSKYRLAEIQGDDRKDLIRVLKQIIRSIEGK